MCGNMPKAKRVELMRGGEGSVYFSHRNIVGYKIGRVGKNIFGSGECYGRSVGPYGVVKPISYRDPWWSSTLFPVSA